MYITNTILYIVKKKRELRVMTSGWCCLTLRPGYTIRLNSRIDKGVGTGRCVYTSEIKALGIRITQFAYSEGSYFSLSDDLYFIKISQK